MKQMGFLQPFLTRFKKILQRHLGPLSFKNQRFNLFTIGSLLCLWFVLGTLLSDTALPLKNQKTERVNVQVRHSQAQEKTTYYILQGTLEAVNKVTLKAETAGVITTIVADKGAVLSKGESILNLSVESRLSKLQEAKAIVDQRQLEYTNAKKLQSHKFRSKTAVAESKSHLESAQAALEQIQIDIEDTKVRAPFDGNVDTRYVQLGDYVKAGDSLVDYIALTPLLAVVFVSEKDIHHIQKGAQAKIHCTHYDTTGEITFISSIADPNTRTYRVEITISDNNKKLRDGRTTAVHIPINTSKVHRFSPAAIAMDDQGKPGIKIIDHTNKVIFHPLDILNHDHTGIWVNGLPDTIKIITVGQYYVKPGDTVNPTYMNTLSPKDQNVPDSTRH